MIWTIVIGFFAGLIAKAVTPGWEPKGFIITTLLGIAGSWVGSMLFGRGVGLIGSAIGAVIVLLLWNFFNAKSSTA